MIFKKICRIVSLLFFNIKGAYNEKNSNFGMDNRFCVSWLWRRTKKGDTIYDADKTRPKKEIFYKEKEDKNKKGRKDKITLKEIEYYRNGKISAERNYIETKNGGNVENGASKFYYENGQLKLERYFANGKLEGIYKTYYENGQLNEEGHYRSDEKSGMWKSYSKNGQLTSEKPYAEDGSGFLNGIRKSYYEDGSLSGESVYKDDRMFEEKTYYKNGQLHTDEFYNETGRKIGTWNVYFDNGNLEAQDIYDKDGDIVVVKKRYCGWDGVRKHNGLLALEKYSFKEYIPKEYNENGVWDSLERTYQCEDDSVWLYTSASKSKDESIGSIYENYYSNGTLCTKEVRYKDKEGEWKNKEYEFFEDGSVHRCNDCKNGEAAVFWERGTFYLKDEAK